MLLILLLLSSIAPYTTAVTVINSSDLPVTSSFGAFYEIEDGQLLHETTAPVIYTVRLPSWLHLIVLPERAQNCSQETTSNKSSSCEIFAAFHEISAKIFSSLRTTPFTFPSVTEESTWGLRCNYISKHFSSSYITPAIVQKYMGFLRSCSGGIIVEENLIDHISKLPDIKPFQSLDQLWTSLFFSNFNESQYPELNTVRAAGETGEVESILSLGVTNYLTEAMRWATAFSKCIAGSIPDSVISPERFYSSLQKLNATANASGYRFVIRPTEPFLPVYFKSEFLTDCTVSISPIDENGNSTQHLDLIVRVLVPLTSKYSDWKHVTVKSYQFVANKTKLEYFPEFPPSLQQENYRFIYDNASQILFASDTRLCDVTKPGFCRVPQIWDSRRVVRSDCPIMLLNGQLHLNSTKCLKKMQVSASEFPGLPLIVKEGTHTFYLTGIREGPVNYDISITCNSENNETFYYEFPEEGALKVELACGCQLKIRKLNNAVIKPELGCGSALNVTIILPVVS